MIEVKTIWTIGHSNRDFEEFLKLLEAFSISQLVDIRNYPGSKRYPHFNKEALEILLAQNNIVYTHLKDLGGRRKPDAGSVNSGWKNSAFRGYADYMATESFRNAINELEKIAGAGNTAYMCSEAVWWSCHRALVSDYLKVKGWKVCNIMSQNKATEHPYTKPARIVDGVLTYQEAGLF